MAVLVKEVVAESTDVSVAGLEAAESELDVELALLGVSSARYFSLWGVSFLCSRW